MQTVQRYSILNLSIYKISIYINTKNNLNGICQIDALSLLMLCSNHFLLLYRQQNNFFSWPGFLSCDTIDILDYNLFA